MHLKLKNFIGFCLGLFLIFLSWCVYKGSLFLESAQGAADSAKELAQSAKVLVDEAKPKVNSTLDSVQTSADQQKKLLERPEVQRSIALFAQSGDDWARLPKNLNIMIHEIRQETLPGANATLDSSKSLLDQGTKTLQSADTVLLTTNTKLEKLTDIAEQDLDDIHKLLSDPNIKTLLANFVNASESVKEIAKDLELSSEEIKQNLPQLLDELKSILENIDKSTQETSVFIASLNKPLTKKQKLLKALIQVAIIAAPNLRR